MNWTYSWGVGGLSALLMAVLGLTGVILQNNYTPAAPQAYLDILEINSNVWFGELVRNLHHWSANLLIVVAVLHLIRVWDQLAFRAITVGTSIINYVPLIGSWLSRLILGGPEVGANTLLNFYSMHISVIPLLIFGLMSYHFWRVRKDGGLTLPKKLDEVEVEKPEHVTTIPYLRFSIAMPAWSKENG